MGQKKLESIIKNKNAQHGAENFGKYIEPKAELGQKILENILNQKQIS